MDRALIWFAEKTAHRKGRVDVLDLPHDDYSGGSHDWRCVKAYFDELGKFASLGKTDYLVGDISRYRLRRKYGTLWDHGTLQNWSGSGGRNQEVRIKIILEKYYLALKKEGRAIICLEKDEKDLERITSLCPVVPDVHRVEEDAYVTSLRPKQISLGSGRDYFLQNGVLYPKYSFPILVEMKKG